MGIQAGDEVIMPDFTMIACAASICYQGAVPVFVDAERKTWNMDPSLVGHQETVLRNRVGVTESAIAFADLPCGS